MSAYRISPRAPRGAASRRALLSAAAAAMLLGPLSARANPWPTRPVRIIVPSPPGGPADLFARLLSEHFARAIGGNFVVDNRPGASGALAAVALAQAEPDGHTLLIGSNSTFVLTPLVLKRPGFDPQRDFAPVGLLTSYAMYLVGRPDLPFRDVTGLVAYARANPGQLNYASFGVGSVGYMVHEVLRRRAGIDVAHVAYPGTAAVLQALMRGEADYAFDSVGNAQPHVDAGKLLALAVSTAERASRVPQVPTLAEAGFAQFDLRIWLGLVAPARTPQPIVQKLNAELERFTAMPETRKRFADNAYDATTETPEAMGERLAREHRFWADVVRDARIALD
ncbi:tripartite tricarboxylate transporter substrate binding protein [Vineibacter terrae]|uniref:Bug family tripartite tricarboxylate transporter substrate binding protein n=1 Tax=Vineibacter terrae TaxID=2586908 RepID=UPI002E36719E|nr:tripartite tricarboxylate transporter substrate binding protein [Vineibacter terrae]HEX2889982.1 tripartite tricarboxylate transporter substrate binding protein [Vineibacter terrae]